MVWSFARLILQNSSCFLQTPLFFFKFSKILLFVFIWGWQLWLYMSWVISRCYCTYFANNIQLISFQSMIYFMFTDSHLIIENRWYCLWCQKTSRCQFWRCPYRWSTPSSFWRTRALIFCYIEFVSSIFNTVLFYLLFYWYMSIWVICAIGLELNSKQFLSCFMFLSMDSSSYF